MLLIRGPITETLSQEALFPPSLAMRLLRLVDTREGQTLELASSSFDELLASIYCIDMGVEQKWQQEE